MSYSISNTFNKTTHFVYDLVMYAFSIPLKLAQKILSLFKSKILGYTPTTPTPLSTKQVSKKLPTNQSNTIIKTHSCTSTLKPPTPVPPPKQYTPKEIQNIVKIQRSFRNKLTALPQDILKKAKITKKVSTVHHLAEKCIPNFLGSDFFAKNKWGKLKEFKKSLEKDHYVFAHGCSFEHGILTDLRTYLDSPTLFPTHSSRWNTHRKFRSGLPSQKFKNIEAYFKSDLCKRINSGITSDDANNSLILSCDGYLDNKDLYESAYFFFKNNINISTPNSSFISSFFQEHIKNTNIVRYAINSYSYVKSQSLSQGRTYLIAIPKTTLQKKESSYVWRSHAFGVVCDHKAWPYQDTPEVQKDFIEVLEQHQKGIQVPHCGSTKTHPQYRILAYNLERDPAKKVFALDFLTDYQQKNNKEIFWNFATLLKQCQRLESISENTSQEDLLSILLRTRFKLNYPSPNKSYFQILKDFLSTTTDKKQTPQGILMIITII